MFPVSTDFTLPMPMQLESVDLGFNQLVGTLPESWSNLSKVSYRHEVVHSL